jgi:hypothetical protein
VHSSAPGVVVTERVTTLNSTGQSVPIYDPSLVGGRHLVLVDPLGDTFDALGVVNPTGHSVSVRLGTVSGSGPALFGPTYSIAAHSDLVLGRGSLAGVVSGVLEVESSGDVGAAAQVRGATLGASTLGAAPE